MSLQQPVPVGTPPAPRLAPRTGGETLELTEFLIPGTEGAGGEVFPADLAELEARRPDRPLKVGDLEVDHLMAPRLEPPTQGREWIVVPRRGETQDADTTPGSFLRCGACACAARRPPMSLGSSVAADGAGRTAFRGKANGDMHQGFRSWRTPWRMSPLGPFSWAVPHSRSVADVADPRPVCPAL